MTSSAWQRMEEVFSRALDQPPEEWRAFIRKGCNGDAELERHVLALLEAHERAGDYLEGSPVDFRNQVYAQYRTEREIGRGGMSIVYLGKRQGGDFERQVAIKILLGAAGPLGGEETRILAGLEHANIARLYDAGITSTGFRYLVMEFVDGLPIDAAAKGRREEEKLRLFLQVCSGVQHAHRSLVVHRDLKPANILVTRDGIVKLLDFGIARMLSAGGGPDQTTGVEAWTPDYASPEQMLGQPITTATDVYSLGVVLCELLTGKRPRGFHGLSLEQMLAQAREEEANAVDLPGDIGLIVQKALRQDPRERYDSVAALAADIGRLLAGHPVEARHASRGYVMGKFLLRHRWTVGAAALAILALAATAGVAIWQAYLARERFAQVRGLSRAVLFELYDAMAPVPGTLPARQLLAERGLAYLDALARRKGSDVSLDLELAQGYLRLGTIEGGMGGANLGRTAASLQRYEEACRILRDAQRRDPGNLAVRRELVEALSMQASAMTARNRAADAVPVAQQAVRLAEENVRMAPHDPASEEQHAKAFRSLGIALQNRKGGRDESLPIWEKLVLLYDRRLSKEPGKPARQRDLAMAHRMAAFSQSLLENWGGVEEHTRKAHTLNRARMEGGDASARVDIAYDLGSLAEVARRKKQFEEAIRFQQQQLAARRDMAAAEPANAQMQSGVAFALTSLSVDYRSTGRFPEAIAAAKEAILLQSMVLARDPGYVHGASNLFGAHAALGQAYADAGLRTKSCAEALAARRLEAGLLQNARLEPGHATWVKNAMVACESR